MKHRGQARSEVLSWSLRAFAAHLGILREDLVQEARDRAERAKALGPLAALL